MAKQNRKITEEPRSNKRIRQIAWPIVYIVAVFLLGVGSSFLKQGLNKADNSKQAVVNRRPAESIGVCVCCKLVS